MPTHFSAEIVVARGKFIEQFLRSTLRRPTGDNTDELRIEKVGVSSCIDRLSQLPLAADAIQWATGWARFSTLIVFVDLVSQGADRNPQYLCRFSCEVFDNEFALGLSNRKPDKCAASPNAVDCFPARPLNYAADFVDRVLPCSMISGAGRCRSSSPSCW